MSQLIVGAAYGYKADDVLPFVTTLRACYSGKITFIVNMSPDPTLIELCVNNGIDFFMMSGDDANPIHMQWARFYHYYNILQHPFYTECTQVFLTDVRDVIFQQNPFVLPLTTDLEFFTEPETIGNSPVNRSWLQARYGLSDVYSMENKRIICSGTIRATVTGALKISEMMKNESERLRANGLDPLDQPQLTHLVYSNSLHNYQIFNNGEGTVSTMHFQQKLCFNPNGLLLNNDGTPTPVVHQWDRTNALIHVFRRQFEQQVINL